MQRIVLIADADAAGRELYSAVLPRANLRVEMADDGHAAFRRALDLQPHVLIASADLTGLSGLKTLHHPAPAGFAGCMDV